MNVIELRVDTFKVSTIEDLGMTRRILDIKQHDSLASASADAKERLANSETYCQISLALDTKNFTRRIGRFGGVYIEANGILYSVSPCNRCHYDCSPVIQAECSEFLDTSDPNQVIDWVRSTGFTPDPSWPCISSYEEKAWKSKNEGNNCIDMQFDHPGWQPSGLREKFTLKDGTVIESGGSYQRKPLIYVPKSSTM